MNAKSLQESDEYIPLPQHLTKYCTMTIHFILVSAIVSLAFGYKFLSFLFMCLYIIGFTYWSKPKYNSIFKKIDIFLVFVTISLLFYYALQFKEKYQRLFIITLLIIIVIAIINETLYRFKIVGVFDNDVQTTSNFSYFTLDYTFPDTMEREYCCKYIVFMHCFLCHIVMNFTWLYCLIGNTYF